MIGVGIEELMAKGIRPKMNLHFGQDPSLNADSAKIKVQEVDSFIENQKTKDLFVSQRRQSTGLLSNPRRIYQAFVRGFKDRENDEIARQEFVLELLSSNETETGLLDPYDDKIIR